MQLFCDVSQSGCAEHGSTLTKPLDRELRLTAAIQGRSAATLIRQALRAHLSTDNPGIHVNCTDVDPIPAVIGSPSGLPKDDTTEHYRDL